MHENVWHLADLDSSECCFFSAFAHLFSVQRRTASLALELCIRRQNSAVLAECQTSAKQQIWRPAEMHASALI